MRLTLLLFASVALTAAADIKGKWLMTATAPDGQEYKIDLVFKEAAAKLAGSMSAPDFEADLQDVQLNGDELSYTIPVHGGCNTKLTVSEASLKGKYACPDGSTGPISAVPAARPAAAASVAGKWKGAAKSTTGTNYQLELDLTVQGAQVTGTISAEQGSTSIEEGRVEGEQFSFKVSTDQGVYAMKFTVTGDQMKGRYTGPSGETGDISLSR